MANRTEIFTLLAVACGWISSVGLASTRLQAQAYTAQSGEAQVEESSASTLTETPLKSSEMSQSEESDDTEDSPQDIDERFETEGYVGVYFALLQQTVPTAGFTGSLFLDDDLRLGLDISFGNSEKIFGSFKTRGASLWGAWEIADTTWAKAGLSYSKLERKSAQEPLSVLTKGEDKSEKNLEIRNDSLGLDFGIGQLWSGARYSIAVDYIGFTVPVLRLTGEKLPTYSLQVARVSALYNIE